MDQATDTSMQAASEAGKKLADNKATRSAGNIAKRGAKNLGRKAGKAALKLAQNVFKILGKLIIKILAVAWPFVLGAIATIILIVMVDHFLVENRGASQEYDFSTEAANKYQDVTNEYGDPELMALSEENAFLQIFYEEEVKNSYWKYYEKGNETVMDYGNSEKLFHPEVRDKYGREEYFLLTAMNLYALEEYLNNFDAFTPQTFVQHVPFEVNEEGRLNSISLTDDDGELNIKSKEYYHYGENDEGRAIYRKKYNDKEKQQYTEGVWDYGLAPVYHYKKYTEEYEDRSQITGAQIWDIEEQKFRPMTNDELNDFKSEGKPSVYNEYKDEFPRGETGVRSDGSSKDVPLVKDSGKQDVYMIQDAVTPMGSIKNNIKQEWRQTNEEVKETHTVSMNVPVAYKEMEQKKDDNGKPLFYNVYYDARYVRTYVPLNRSGLNGPGIDYGGGVIGQPGSGYTPRPPSRPKPPSRPTPPTRPTPTPTPEDDGRGNTPIYEDPHQGRTRFEWGEVPDGFPELPLNPDVAFTAPDGWKVDFREKRGGGTTTVDTGEHNKIMVEVTKYKLELKEHQVETTGLKWEYIPLYDGEPDTSDLNGLDYYHEYFEYYKNYVTEDSFPNAQAQLDGLGVKFTDEELAKIKVNTPSDILKVVKLYEERNIAHVDPQTGIKRGKYDTPLSVEERIKEMEEGTKWYNKNKEHPVMKAVRDLQVQALVKSQGGSVLDLKDVNFAKESNSTAVQNASEFYQYFEQYGAEFGIDPMLLLAIAAHESNGRHYANPDEYQSYGVRRSYDYEGGGYADLSAIGLMQVRPLHSRVPSKPRDTSAYSHVTKRVETFYATAQELHDPETNIKFATMLLANEIHNADGDVLVGIGSYHYGRKFAQHVKEQGFQGWSLEAESSYLNSGEAGSLGFIPNVLRFYLPTADSPFPWALDRSGNRISNAVEGVDMASENAVNIEVAGSVSRRKTNINTYTYSFNQFMKDMGKLPLAIFAEVGDWILGGANAVGKFFGLTDDIDRTNYYLVGESLTGDQAEELVHMMMSYEEGLYMYEYEAMDEEELEKRFLDMFLKDVRNEQDRGMVVDVKKFFPDGYQSPVKDVDITEPYGRNYGNEDFNGIQLAAPGGTEIFAVADGVILVKKKGHVEIDHGNDVTTVYRGIGEVTLGDYKKGDKIKKGTLIGRGSSSDNNLTKNGSFAFGLYNPMPTDPSWIVDPSLLAGGGGSLGVDPNAIGFQHPYYGKTSKVTSHYSKSRLHPRKQVWEAHHGLDIAGTGKYLNVNTGLGSIADGIINHKGYDPDGWGYYVVVEHPGSTLPDGRKMFSLYAHLVQPSPLSVGTKVTAGDIVGNEGTTGSSTGNHLHIEIIVGHGTNGITVRGQNRDANTTDPYPLLYY